MKISLLTMGTFGDVRPFLALAYGLEEQGHQVTLAGPENFQEYVTKTYNRPYLPIGMDSQQVLESEEGRKWMASGDMKQFLNQLNIILHENRYALQRDAAAACEDCDLIIAHPLQTYYGCYLSEKLNKPILFANPFPMFPATEAFPHFLVTTRRLPLRFMNKMTFRLVFKVNEKGLRKDMNEWRIKLGLAPSRGTLFNKIEHQNIPVMQAFSQALIAHPKDWGKHVVITGQWKIPSQYVPEQEKAELDKNLVAWLDEGPPPIYFGFGSLPVLEPQQMIDMAVAIAHALQTRAIIASGWSDMDNGGNRLPDTVRMIKSANHELLFPRCSTIIHHGGAGTTHTAIESGVPSIICSTYADQPFWGERIVELGIGRHIPFSKLNQEKLLQAIRELQDPVVYKIAATVAKQMKAENGLETALKFLERQIPTAPVFKN
ncbi:glycosyltransferase [Paenibacillus sp. GCM10012307]|uniref:Glycosyltransferase family 1 protein n=1 Tax=Paenibacillus roseus TaxID=2798579 RepID=A0A934J690_9BACL|nr:glycosyltransferase [Paenibacillus roseus]MBJ6362494.1 glycosyltransferase family 1 protein [Paenibacillus roseus]